MSGFGGGGEDWSSRGRGGGRGRGRGRGKGSAGQNAYWHFVEEIRVQKRLNTWNQAQAEAGDLWGTMDKSSRQKYVDMAKDSRNNAEKMTSTGVSLSSILKEQDHIRRAEEEENRQIEMIVRDEACNIQNKIFYTISTNYYCCTNAGQYSTCEVAIVKFSLESGIISEFHSFIDTTIPMGYQYDAKMKSEEIGIPAPPFEESTKDLIFLISQIISYLEASPKNDSDNSLPPLYAMPDDIKSIKNFLENLCEEAARPLDTFRVYSVSKLFYELSNNIENGKLPHICIAQDWLTKDTFTYSRGIACEMHEQGDFFPKCSLSIAKRWSYTICNFCCQLLNIDILPGRHIPPPVTMESASFRMSSRASSKYSNSVQEDYQSNQGYNSASSEAQDNGWTVSRSKKRY